MEISVEKDLGFVFIHGAGLGAWIWEDVINKISYPYLAIDFPGRGKHLQTATKGLPLEKYVEIVYTDLEKLAPKKVIIVAHSISGIIGIELADKLGDRLGGFIAVGAVIPKRNRSFISSLPKVNRIILQIMLMLAGTKPPESVIRSGLCEDLDEENTIEVINRFVPESKKLYTDRLQTRCSLPHSMYIQLTQDRELNAGIQKQMIANMNPNQVIDLNCGHLPMLSKPKELAHILNTYAKAVYSR